MLVGPAKHQREQTAPIEKAGVRQPGQDFRCVGGAGPIACYDADLGGQRRDEIAEHRRHDGPLLLRQSIGGIEEEITADSSQAARSARARGIDRAVCCKCSDRPFLGHHYLSLLDDRG